MARLLRKIDDFIKVKDEEDGRPVNRWKSPDILPVLPKNRTFGASDYASYWYGNHRIDQAETGKCLL